MRIRKLPKGSFLILIIFFVVISFDADCLVMVAEIFTKQGTAAAVCGIPRDFKPECDVAVVVDVQFLNGYIRKLICPVHKTALIVDDQCF